MTIRQIRPQGRLPPERMNRAEDPEKHLLERSGPLAVITKEVQRQPIDHPLVLADELGAEPLRRARRSVESGRLPAPDLGQVMKQAGFRQSLCHP